MVAPFAQPTGLTWLVRKATARGCRAHGPTLLAGRPPVLGAVSLATCYSSSLLYVLPR